MKNFEGPLNLFRAP